MTTIVLNAIEIFPENNDQPSAFYDASIFRQ